MTDMFQRARGMIWPPAPGDGFLPRPHRDPPAPEIPGAGDLLLRREDLPPAIRVPEGVFALGRSPGTRPGPGSAADRQAGGRHPLARGGRRKPGTKAIAYFR